MPAGSVLTTVPSTHHVSEDEFHSMPYVWKSSRGSQLKLRWVELETCAGTDGGKRCDVKSMSRGVTLFSSISTKSSSVQ